MKRYTHGVLNKEASVLLKREASVAHRSILVPQCGSSQGQNAFGALEAIYVVVIDKIIGHWWLVQPQPLSSPWKSGGWNETDHSSHSWFSWQLASGLKPLVAQMVRSLCNQETQV